MKKIAAIALLIVAINACKKTDTTNPEAAVSKTILNVAYGSDPVQIMDVYLPGNRSTATTNVLVMIHGGGWTGGDKADFTAFVDTIQRRLPNYAVFNLNYRLANGASNLFPTQENDIKAAIEFIYSKKQEYTISDNYALMGASAGGHLALLQGYKDSVPVKVKAIVDFYGPADMAAMYNSPAIPGGELAIYNVMGATPTSDSLLYAHSSPINFINTASAPTIILHGGSDIIVSHSQSDSLYARLAAAGVPASFITYPTQGHGWTNADTLTNSLNHVQNFLVQHMP